MEKLFICAKFKEKDRNVMFKHNKNCILMDGYKLGTITDCLSTIFIEDEDIMDMIFLFIKME